MNNISKGFSRGSWQEFMHSLTTAKGEAEERKSLPYRGFDVHYFSETRCNEIFAAADSHVKKTVLLFIALIHPPSAGKSLKNESSP